MAVSVRLDPVLEALLERQASLLGVTKSEFIKDALERVLGLKDPAQLLREVRSRKPTGRGDLSENTGATVKARLRAKRPD